MPYILTPTGWRVLSENAADPEDVPRKRRKASADTNKKFITHVDRALDSYAKGNYQEGSTDHTKANLAYLDLPAGARKRHEELRDKLNRAAKAARGEVFEGSAELNESQIELLESLYEDGYLTEEQLDEIFKQIANFGRKVKFKYLTHRADGKVNRSEKSMAAAGAAIERAKKPGAKESDLRRASKKSERAKKDLMNASLAVAAARAAKPPRRRPK